MRGNEGREADEVVLASLSSKGTRWHGNRDGAVGTCGSDSDVGTVRSLQDEDDDPGSTDKSIQKQWLAKIN